MNNYNTYKSRVYIMNRIQKLSSAIIVILLVSCFGLANRTYAQDKSALIDGQKDLAIKNYTKSLELNPNNSGALRMLDRINKTM